MCVITGSEMKLLHEPWKEQTRNASMESCCWKLWTQLCSKLNHFLPGLLGKKTWAIFQLFIPFSCYSQSNAFSKTNILIGLKKKKLFRKFCLKPDTSEPGPEGSGFLWVESQMGHHTGATQHVTVLMIWVSTDKVWPPRPALQVLTEAQMSSIYSATLMD